MHPCVKLHDLQEPSRLEGTFSFSIGSGLNLIYRCTWKYNYKEIYRAELNIYNMWRNILSRDNLWWSNAGQRKQRSPDNFSWHQSICHEMVITCINREHKCYNICKSIWKLPESIFGWLSIQVNIRDRHSTGCYGIALNSVLVWSNSQRGKTMNNSIKWVWTQNYTSFNSKKNTPYDFVRRRINYLLDLCKRSYYYGFPVEI